MSNLTTTLAWLAGCAGCLLCGYVIGYLLGREDGIDDGVDMARGKETKR